MKVSLVAQMREMDRAAIERYGIAESLLMENAGRAAFDVLAGKAELRDRRVVVVCGGGNNGGDGLVVARHIASAGGDVVVLLLSDADRYGGASRINYDAVCALGIPVVRVTSADAPAGPIAKADVLVDALLGTGIDRRVEGVYADAIAAMNRSEARVLSIDIPSGVNGDTGQVMGAAVRADWTVTFGLPKAGNLLLPGWAMGGELFVSHISFPPALYESGDLRVAINTPIVPPARDVDGHKGSFGQALFVAGAANYFGAPYFCAMSYLKAGGGYARLAAPASIVPVIAARGPEIVFIPQAENQAGSMGRGNLDGLVELAERMDFVVIGPGLSLDAETQELVRQLVASVDKPMLIDGDGLTAVHSDPACVRDRRAHTVLTPHLGEMARLTGCSVEELRRDSVAALRALCEDVQATVVMKGAHTLIGYADGRVYVNMTGNSGMGTAGSGDVLAGAIAAMHGLGLPFDEAVRMGVFVHGLAGDLAAAAIGEDGMTATDVLSHMPAAVRALRGGADAPLLAGYLPQVV